MNWQEILGELGSTAIIVAAICFFAKSMVTHMLQRDLASHDSKLRDRTAQVLADTKQSAQAAEQERKVAFDKELLDYKQRLERRGAKEDRIRDEVIRWANPILGSVKALQARLRNILRDRGYLALSRRSQTGMNPEWSITVEYFLPSTIYLFCQYFCYVRLLEERLSFELFEKQDDKDHFFERVHEVGQTLSSYPHRGLAELSGTGDRQVFTLQQRALGEAMAVGIGDECRCIRYAEFLSKWNCSKFRETYEPLVRFIESLEPRHEHRWRRLEMMSEALEKLHDSCLRLLADRDKQ